MSRYHKDLKELLTSSDVTEIASLIDKEVIEQTDPNKSISMQDLEEMYVLGEMNAEGDLIYHTLQYLCEKYNVSYTAARKQAERGKWRNQRTLVKSKSKERLLISEVKKLLQIQSIFDTEALEISNKLMKRMNKYMDLVEEVMNEAEASNVKAYDNEGNPIDSEVKKIVMDKALVPNMVAVSGALNKLIDSNRKILDISDKKGLAQQLQQIKETIQQEASVEASDKLLSIQDKLEKLNSDKARKAFKQKILINKIAGE